MAKAKCGQSLIQTPPGAFSNVLIFAANETDVRALSTRMAPVKQVHVVLTPVAAATSRQTRNASARSPTGTVAQRCSCCRLQEVMNEVSHQSYGIISEQQALSCVQGRCDAMMVLLGVTVSNGLFYDLYRLTTTGGIVITRQILGASFALRSSTPRSGCL